MTHKFDRQGLLALDPRAFAATVVSLPSRDNLVIGDVEVVRIVGPLEHHLGALVNGVAVCDCYDLVLERAAAAFSGNAKAVVLRIDSPGGLVSGVFETARALRGMARASGKTLIAYVDGTVASAAYALACAADRIVAPESGVVGSIGVIDTRVDSSAADAAMGLRVALVTSGSRKADGNPHQAMSPAELIERQALVDNVAGVFFALVKDFRGVDAAPLEARLFVGAKAKEAGLVDEIQSFSDLLAALASQATGATMSKYSEARAALEEAAKGDDDEAKRAQKALAAMDDEEPSDEPAAESDDDKGEDNDEGDEPEASAAPAATATGAISSTTAAALAAEIQRLSGKAAKSEAQERKDLLATRPDISNELRSVLSKASIAEVREVLAQLPKPPKSTAVKPPAANAASATPRATVGGAPNGVQSTSQYAKAMDERMGLTRVGMGVKREGNTMVFGAMVREDAAPGAGNGGTK